MKTMATIEIKVVRTIPAPPNVIEIHPVLKIVWL
jgi:hypothetical protein